jgi:glycosyltransferase involved in cell wall biosynthesis
MRTDGQINCCVVIPVYDHEHAIRAVLEGVLQHGLHCILVDDGSAAGCALCLDALAREFSAQVTLLRLPSNQGKGAAVLAGFDQAVQQGYTHALQIDADGQHCTGDIPKFLQAAGAHPNAVIAGCPEFDASVPRLRLYARYLTHVCVWLNTLSFDIRDSMCGFRLYPLAAVMKLTAGQRIGSHMNFDTDILVRLYWQGLEVVNLPTPVTYPSDGVSHFRLWMDNVLITRMHALLFFGMLIRVPRLLARKLGIQ